MLPGLYKENKIIYDWEELINNNYIQIENHILKKCNLEKGDYLVLDKSVKEIKCITNLKGIYLSEETERIDIHMLNGEANLCKIDVDKNNKKYSSIDGVLFNRKQTRLIKYPRNKEEKEYKIPSSVNEIDYSAFYKCYNLEKIKINKKATKINDYSFQHCTKLTEIELSDELIHIGRLAFGGCKKIEEIIIPKSLKIISEFVFYGCTGLKSIKYAGTYEKFNKIKNKNELLNGTFLTVENIEYVK